jgi:hypothetical protein
MSNIPLNISEVFEELKTEITWLHGRWIIYRQLFGHSEKRIDLLNECASTFFYIIQDMLLDAVQVSLSKMTDPAQTGNFENLSIDQLQQRVETHGDPQLATSLRKLRDKLHDKCQPFRMWRNKRLAHLDLTTAMQSSSNPLPGISRQMIEDSLGILREYMNTIERYYSKSETGYEHFIMSSDGDFLISVLKYGLRYEELLKDRKISFEDWHQAEWKDA